MSRELAIIGREQERCEQLYRSLAHAYPSLDIRCIPMIETIAVPFALPNVASGSMQLFLFTSPRAVEHFFAETDLPKGAQVAALGRATASALQQKGVIADHISSVETSVGMAKEVLTMLEQMPPSVEVIQPTSDIAGRYLEDSISSHGVTFRRIVTYSVSYHHAFERQVAELPCPPRFVVFYSPSGVRAWSGATSARPCAISVGPVTTKELVQHGWQEIYESTTPDGMDILSTVSNHIKIELK